MSDLALDPWTMSYADIAAYVTVVAVALATVTALVFMGRATKKACAVLGVALLLPLAAAFFSDDSDALRLERIEVQP